MYPVDWRMITAGNLAGIALGNDSMNDLTSLHATLLISEFPYLSLKLRITSFPILSPILDSNMNTCFVVSILMLPCPSKRNILPLIFSHLIVIYIYIYIIKCIALLSIFLQFTLYF